MVTGQPRGPSATKCRGGARARGWGLISTLAFLQFVIVTVLLNVSIGALNRPRAPCSAACARPIVVAGGNVGCGGGGVADRLGGALPHREAPCSGDNGGDSDAPLLLLLLLGLGDRDGRWLGVTTRPS